MNQYFDTGIITDGDTCEITFEIFSVLGRNAKCLHIINDGTVKMFVKTYTDIKSIARLGWKVWPTAECWIYPGQRRGFHDVYQVLVGKTSIGNQYRITEFDIVQLPLSEEKK